MAAANQDTTRPQNTRAIMSFLREHAPFSSMDDTHLAHLAEHATLSIYADGDLVLSPEDGQAKQFYVGRPGRIRGERHHKTEERTRTPWQISHGECLPAARPRGQ